jgi:hypothetical protein
MTKLRGRGYCWWVGCGLIFIGMIFVGVIVLGGSLGIYWFTPLLKTPPSVRIIQPDQTLEIESGQAVVLVARGESSNGINYINFLVNDIPLDQKISSQPKQETLEAVFPWFSSQPGIHKLSVVAYDNFDTASSSDWVVVVVNPRSIPGALQPDSQGEDANNQQLPSDSEGQLPGDLAAGDEQAVLDQILINLDGAEQFPIDRPGQPQDAPPEITTFDIQHARDGNQVSGTYHVDALDDLGLAYLIFSFASLDDPFHPISDQHTCGGARTCAVDGHFQLPQGGWVLSAQAVDTSGQVSPIRARQVHVLAGPQPPAIALDLGGLNLQVDPQVTWDDIRGAFHEPGDDIGIPRFVGFHCGGKANIIEVPYTYQSDHGDQVYVGAFARSESDNAIIGAGHMLIEDRSGVAKFEIENLSEEPVRTDQLELHFRANPADYFYKEIADLTMVWPVPKPDLQITYAGIKDGQGQVEVQNIGCAAVDGFNLVVEPLEGEDVYEFVDVRIPKGGKYTWTTSVDPNLLSRGFQVTVDPDNTIAEIDEENNFYEKRQITLKHIDVYMIDIYDTMEDDEPFEDSIDGEFYFNIFVNDVRITRRPRVGDEYWVMGLRSHIIEQIGYWESIILSPMLDWNQDLTIEVRAVEHDGALNMDDFAGRAIRTHSHDMLQEGNWKAGGEFHLMSDTGKFQIHYRLVVE